MDNELKIIRDFMSCQGIQYLLVNSTNEFLVEYNPLHENSRYKLTSFTGSTGEALITPGKVYLFVDGRYHIQADQEVDHSFVEVVKLQTGQNFIDEMINFIPQDQTLGLFAKKNSQKKTEEISQHRKVKLLNLDPLDEEQQNNYRENVILDTKFTGLSSDEKIAKISQNLSDNQALYITDLDEVSYLFNMRNFSCSYSSKIKGKALILKDNAVLFVQEKFNILEDFLRTLNKEIYVDKQSINAYDYNLIGDKARDLQTNPIQAMKSIKTDAELEHLKDAYDRTDKALSAIRKFIMESDYITEFDIAVQVALEFRKQGAKSLSFPAIVAIDENSALVHNPEPSPLYLVENGSLILVDCGGYFEGGLATDATRVFVKGEPLPLHKKIYTTVLKAFLRAYNFENPQNGYEIDKSVREFFSTQNSDGFVFNHGLGHGIGITVHEYPPNLSPSEIAKAPLKDGMVFSIEPGLYKQGEFGVRLENACLFKDGKIHSLSKMNFEKNLIDFDMLTEQEKEWLSKFEVE